MLKTIRFWRDVLFGIIFIFAFMWAAGKFLNIFSFLDPVGEALEDMQITDQVFSNPDFRERPLPEDRVTVVNFGRLDRAGIAQLVNVINKYEPRVIGIDTFFSSLKEDSLSDLLLAEALSNVENLVLGTKLINPDDNPKVPYFYGLHTSHPFFSSDAQFAHVNLSAEEAGTQQHELKVVREFFPVMTYRDTIENEIQDQMAFGVKLAEYYDPEAVEEFLARNNEEEIINYQGNTFNIEKLQQSKYFVIDWIDVFDENFDPSLVKDKIVLFGMVGETIEETYWVEDKFFTPMNEKYAGRADLDMYGVVIHANIVTMVLNRDYIDRLSQFQQLLIAVVVCFFNVALFTLIYRKLPHWYDGLTKLIQLLQVIFIFGVIVYMFNRFNMKLELTLSIAAVAFAGDSLEVLYGVGYNIFRRKKRSKLFTIQEEHV